MTTVDLDTIVLERGSHVTREDGVCVMELAAWLAGREHSDRPPCVSPTIGAFLRNWNDQLGDEDRQMLKPYAALVLNTATTKLNEKKRSWLATDWLVREFAPVWLDRAGLAEHARRLRALPELSSAKLAIEAQPIIDAARDAAWDAAGDAARAAAGNAAWDAVGAAAWDAVGAAAGDAAWDAAWAAAGDAAWDAAGDVAWAAAGDALAETVTELQQSALGLLDRMIAVGK